MFYCSNFKWAFCGCPFLSQTQLQLELDLVCCDSTIIQRISNINTILVNDQLFDKIVHVHIFTAYYWIFWEKEWLNIFEKETDPCGFNCWVTLTGGWSGIVTPEWGDSFVTYKVGKLFAVCCHCYFRHDYKVLVDIMSFQVHCDLREKDILSDVILVLDLLNFSTIKFLFE